jgi:hypothetical protein
VTRVQDTAKKELLKEVRASKEELLTEVRAAHFEERTS